MRTVIVKYFIGLLGVLVLAAGLTKLAYDRYEDEIRTRTESSAPTTTTAPPVRPAANQVVVSGTVRTAHVEGARLSPLAMPLTVSTAHRGDGSGGTFEHITVDGKEQTAVWDAGTPLQLSGDGSLAVGPLTLDAASGAATVTFDGLPQGIAPGNYSIGSPVAVGSSGLATPHDTLAFTAGPTSTLTLSVDATVALPAGTVAAKGPGKVVLEGDLTVLSPDGSTRKIGSITLASGPFQLTLQPQTDGTFTVQATLQGATTTA